VARPIGFEWGIVLTGSAVVGTLAVFYAFDWDQNSTPISAGPVRAEVKAEATPVVRPPPPPPVSRPAQRSKTRSTFAFTAARGDSWLQVRAGSFGGRVLYEGKLLEGETVRLRSRRLWIRFGAASYIDLTIQGRPVRLPAFGTYDAFAMPRRVVPDRKIYATAAQSP
jgi:hypothetical protein